MTYLIPIYKFDGLVAGTVVKRPSAICKTPYVGDVSIDDTSSTILAHCLSQGCAGLCDKDKEILLTPMKHKVWKDVKPHCTYSVQMAYHNKTYICINPKVAEKIVHYCLCNNLLPSLSGLQQIQREVTVGNSRIDFAGIDAQGRQFYLEVKNVPLALKDDKGDMVAVFPIGGIQKKFEENGKIVKAISPRAYKHINELALLLPNSRCIMCFVVQRSDVIGMQINPKEEAYKKAMDTAIEAGVELLILIMDWYADGTGYLYDVQTEFIP